MTISIKSAIIIYFSFSYYVNFSYAALELKVNKSGVDNYVKTGKNESELEHEAQQKNHQKSHHNDNVGESDAAILVRYDGAQLWRISFNDEKDFETINELQNKFDAHEWMSVDKEVDIFLNSNRLQDAEEFLKKSNLSRVVLIDNLQKFIENENPPKSEIEMLQNRKGHRMTWKAYHRMADIHNYLDYLAKTYPDLCSVETIGRSTQNRPLKLLKISNGNPNNKAIWIDGGMHAREWISPATSTFIIEALTENWEDLPNYMRTIDWYILPLANPDGYEYTHDNDRLWRKNRGGQSFPCAGVDLNRNFGYKWGGAGNSRNPCSEIYGGKNAFSEPESSSIRKFLSKYGANKFKSYISFHSYGQYILYPWGHDRSVPQDYRDLDRVGREAATNILKNGGGSYRVGPSGKLLYPASGGSDDWARGELGIKYAYTVEMRDTGRYGFILPAHMIETTANEGYIFVDTVAKAVSQL